MIDLGQAVILPKSLTDLTVFAPVATFEVDETNISSGVLRGVAAPERGKLPCAMALTADTKLISSAKAGRFSSKALDMALRLGWCGFQIGGLAQSIAFGGGVQLRCAVSGRVLRRWDGADLAEVIKPSRSSIDVAGLLVRVRAELGSQQMQHVVPFALQAARTHGARVCVEQSYRYFFGRGTDSSADGFLSSTFDNEAALMAFWKLLVESSEFRSKSVAILPGPFDLGFPFPLDILG